MVIKRPESMVKQVKHCDLVYMLSLSHTLFQALQELCHHLGAVPGSTAHPKRSKAVT